jgi:ABC-type phosphate/phosphonate transport system substrate-binding protein
VPDQRKYTYLVMTDAQAAEAWATLRKYLGQKFGKPSDENVSPSYRAAPERWWDGRLPAT